MQSNKECYIDICKNSNIPLFSQHFWMDSVCGGENWDVIIIKEKNNILGTLVYFLNKLDNGFEIRKAMLTQNNGIIFNYPKNMKYNKKISFENKVINLVIDEIEKLDIVSYRQYYHYSFDNWLPFYWRGYSQSTRYTYVIDDTSNMENVIKKYDGNIRNYLKKAKQKVQVFSDMSANDFYEFNKKTYDRQNLNIPYDFKVFNDLYENLKERNSLKILYAIDNEKNIHSAALFAMDNDSVYYLMSGSDANFRSSQALTLLIHSGIEFASENNKKFDFEGSMKQNIEKFFRQFGARQKQYFDIQKKFI